MTEPKVVDFRIADGTGTEPWNSPENIVELELGDTLRLINDDSITHQLHTNGSPCAHGSEFAPGEEYLCVTSKVFDPESEGALYDHIAGESAKFWVKVIPRKVKETENKGNAEFDKIAALVEKGCAGAACHGESSSLNSYVGNEALFNSKAAAISARITADDEALLMPPLTSGRSLTNEEIRSLQDYIGALD